MPGRSTCTEKAADFKGLVRDTSAEIRPRDHTKALARLFQEIEKRLWRLVLLVVLLARPMSAASV
jgi:hypothetical protein